MAARGGMFDDEVRTAVVPDGEGALPVERRGQLSVLSGARAGHVTELGGTRVRVGKGDDNDVVLPDPTVSREHFELLDQGDGWLVRHDGPTEAAPLTAADWLVRP